MAVRVEDPILTSEHQEILNSFKQGHIIEEMHILDLETKVRVMEQLLLIRFDLLDLVGRSELRSTTSSLRSRTRTRTRTQKSNRPSRSSR